MQNTGIIQEPIEVTHQWMREDSLCDCMPGEEGVRGEEGGVKRISVTETLDLDLCCLMFRALQGHGKKNIKGVLLLDVFFPSYKPVTFCQANGKNSGNSGSLLYWNGMIGSRT